MNHSTLYYFSSTFNYDPFGSVLVGRSWSGGSEYRYGFNGQEQDDEVYGNGNLNTAEFWEYDTRLGRRWNLDPINQPWQSLYSALNNSPICFFDRRGNISSPSAAPTDANGHKTKSDLKFFRKFLWVITFQYNDTHFNKWYEKRQFKNKCCDSFTGEPGCKLPFKENSPIVKDERNIGGTEFDFSGDAQTKEVTTYDLDVVATGTPSGVQTNQVFNQTYNLPPGSNCVVNTDAFAVPDQFIITDCNTGATIYTSPGGSGTPGGPVGSETGTNQIVIPGGTTCIQVVVNPNPNGGGTNTNYRFTIVNTNTPVVQTVKTYKWRIFRTNKTVTNITFNPNTSYNKRKRYY